MKWRIKRVDIRLRHGEEKELSLILTPEDRHECQKPVRYSNRLLGKYKPVERDSRRIPPG